MASKTSHLALFLLFNILFFTLTSACGHSYCKPKPKPKPRHHHRPRYTHKPCPPGTPTYGGGGGRCPMDALKLGVCADVLHGLIHAKVGQPPKTPCCPLIEGLVDLEAAVCLCTAIKANILGLHLNLPISLSLLLNYCGKSVPHGFQCP